MSKIIIPEPEFEEEDDERPPSPAKITRDHRLATALRVWIESAGEISAVMRACDLKTKGAAERLVKEAHEAFKQNLGASAEATLVRHQYILQKLTALIALEVEEGNIAVGLAGLKALEREAKMMGIDKGREDDGVRTIVVDLRMPDQQDVVDGEIVETDVTPELGGGT